jgi:lysophospholipase L1-like esterase
MANIFLVYGDSIAFGYYDKEGGWTDRLKRYFADESAKDQPELDTLVYNLAISGDTTNEVLRRLKKETVPRSWEDRKTTFIFAIGINDTIIIDGKCATSENKFSNNLNEIITYSKKFSDDIIFVGPTLVGKSPLQWSPTEIYKNKHIRKYNEILRRFSQTYNLPYLDMVKTFESISYKNLLIDHLHPNTKGHEFIYNTVKHFLEVNKYI